ncbi:hypothetical protein ACQEV4_16675 [Streptomyces shenzhenensis]
MRDHGSRPASPSSGVYRAEPHRMTRRPAGTAATVLRTPADPQGTPEQEAELTGRTGTLTAEIGRLTTRPNDIERDSARSLRTVGAPRPFRSL